MTKKPKKTSHLRIRIEPKTIEKAEEMARSESCGLSVFVRNSIQSFLRYRSLIYQARALESQGLKPRKVTT